MRRKLGRPKKHKSLMSREQSKFASFSYRFYEKYKVSALIWLILLVFGVITYTTLIKRAGFPSVEVPFTIATGAYFVDDVDKVDSDLTKPISDLISEIEIVKSVETTASGNFFTFFAELESETSSAEGTEIIEQSIIDSGLLPPQANLQYLEIDAGKFQGQYDVLLSVFSKEELSLNLLEQKATEVASLLEQEDYVTYSEIIPVFESGINPITGQKVTEQSSFARYGQNESDIFSSYQAVTIGVLGSSEEDFDILDFSSSIHKSVESINNKLASSGDKVEIAVAADFADSIQNQINGLQNNVLTGLIAVSFLTLLLITWRASLITALFIVTVLFTTVSILYLLGNSINTITLFGLVLSLGLFVDDATIVVEAVDALKYDFKQRRSILKEAIKKVAAASMAGTLTTVMVFFPLLFVGGILGDFIRLLPTTIIIALFSSLILSLTLIPFLTRFTLLTKNNLKRKPPSKIAKFESYIGGQVASTVLYLKNRSWKGYLIASSILLISVGAIFGSGYYASKLRFNIFPTQKDSDVISVNISFNPGTSIEKAQQIVGDIDDQIINTINGENVVKSLYFDSSSRSAQAQYELLSYRNRSTTSREFVQWLDNDFSNFSEGKILFNQTGAGPPSDEFPFKMQIFSEDENKSLALAQDVSNFLEERKISRLGGTTSQITDTEIGNIGVIARNDGRRFVEVSASYDADDVSALVQTTQTDVENEFTSERLANYGLNQNDIGFDFGQESENAESFSSLLFIGPLAVLLMFILLAVQFRSLIQPLLIFMAIPFSFLGVTAGLYYTDNLISFFTMIGFFGLIGIAVNNTILLTDYANQERRAGLTVIEAISEATRKRFRPLITTSLTTFAALTPLALTDPFWEPLAITIMFGLLSSTLLVIIAFPYYYLASEWLSRSLKRLIRRIKQQILPRQATKRKV